MLVATFSGRGTKSRGKNYVVPGEAAARRAAARRGCPGAQLRRVGEIPHIRCSFQSSNVLLGASLRATGASKKRRACRAAGARGKSRAESGMQDVNICSIARVMAQQFGAGGGRVLLRAAHFRGQMSQSCQVGLVSVIMFF